MTKVFWLAEQGLALFSIVLCVPMEFFLSCVVTFVIDSIKKWGGTMENKLKGSILLINLIVKTMGTVLVENALLA